VLSSNEFQPTGFLPLPPAIEGLVSSGAYGKKPPHAYTQYERQGRDGTLQARAWLMKHGFTEVYFNQDRNNEQKKRPDILAYSPLEGWIMAEAHNYIWTPTVDTLTCYRKDRRKSWDLLPGLPKLVIMVKTIWHSPKALRDLAKDGLDLVNGISEEGVLSNSNSKPVCNSSLTGNYSRLVKSVNSIGDGCSRLGLPPVDDGPKWRWCGRGRMTDGRGTFLVFSNGGWFTDRYGNIISGG